jgi:hypothetical protein
MIFLFLLRYTPSGVQFFGESFGGLGPRLTADSTGIYSNSKPLSAQRSISPPRLISPRPTNSLGNKRSTPKHSSSGSTYLALAILPRSTTLQPLGSARASARALRQRGSRYRASFGSIGTLDIPLRSSIVTTVSGGRRPLEVVIISCGGKPIGGFENLFTYAIFPRK